MSHEALQLRTLAPAYRRLHRAHGAGGVHSIDGAGRTKNARVMFVFMNPTARNVAAFRSWRGIRAPWLGTKNVWRLFANTGFIRERTLAAILRLAPADWSPAFAERLYREIAGNGGYITNLAKCTQADARPLPDRVFRAYLHLMHREILLVRPKCIVTFGNQVSSVLLGKPIRVSVYKNAEHETLRIGTHTFPVYPVHYPVGQGQRNMPLAIRRIRNIIRASAS